HREFVVGKPCWQGKTGNTDDVHRHGVEVFEEVFKRVVEKFPYHVRRAWRYWREQGVAVFEDFIAFLNEGGPRLLSAGVELVAVSRRKRKRADHNTARGFLSKFFSICAKPDTVVPSQVRAGFAEGGQIVNRNEIGRGSCR